MFGLSSLGGNRTLKLLHGDFINRDGDGMERVGERKNVIYNATVIMSFL